MKNKDKQVRKLANKIINRYKLSVPVNFDQVFTTGCCKLNKIEMPDFQDGYTDFTTKPYEIFINDTISYEKRKRFTIAHELGHVFIPWHGDVTIPCQTDNYTTDKKLDIQEREANIFASELLMPSNWVKEKVLEYENTSLKYMIEDLSLGADTSIMACIYALDNAFDSGNIMIVKKDGYEYGKKFIAPNTCSTHFRGLSVEEVCNKFCLSKEKFKKSYYEIEYYKFKKCPSIDEVKEEYNKNLDIEYCLNKVSNNNIFSILHCLGTIINYIPDNYEFVIYEENTILAVLGSEECNIKFKYGATKDEILSDISDRFSSYGDIELSDGVGLVWVKEDVYEENEEWKDSIEDATSILRDILFEVYGDENKLHRVEGIVGTTYGRYKTKSRDEIYNKIKISFQNKDDLKDFSNHEYFEKYITLRLNNIVRKGNKRR